MTIHINAHNIEEMTAKRKTLSASDYLEITAHDDEGRAFEITLFTGNAALSRRFRRIVEIINEPEAADEFAEDAHVS